MHSKEVTDSFFGNLFLLLFRNKREKYIFNSLKRITEEIYIIRNKITRRLHERERL